MTDNDKRRKKCPLHCPCLCHDMGGGPVHPGQPCPGKADAEPDLAALNAWHEAHPYGREHDSPRTSLWFPREAPSVLLDTVNRGTCHEPDEQLHDPERPTCHVHLGTTIDVGGYLSDMEAYFAAVVDAIRYARWQADTIAHRMAAEAEGGAS